MRFENQEGSKLTVLEVCSNLCMPTKKLNISWPVQLKRGQERSDLVSPRRQYIPANVRNVAAENRFYRLWELSRADIEFVREAGIKDSPERSSHSRETASTVCFGSRRESSLEAVERGVDRKSSTDDRDHCEAISHHGVPKTAVSGLRSNASNSFRVVNEANCRSSLS